MTLWGYTISSTLEWTAFILLLILAMFCIFVVIWFVEKYTTGIVGGFILIAGGMGMVLGPSYRLISSEVYSEASFPLTLVCGASIICGCVAVLVGAFSLRNFQDF